MYKLQLRFKPTHAPLEPWTVLPGCSNVSLFTAVCLAVSEIRMWHQNTLPYQAVRIVDKDTRGIWAQWSTDSHGNEA